MLMISGGREGARAIPSVGRALDELWSPLPSNDYRDTIVGFESGKTLSPLSSNVRRRCARVFAWTYPRRAARPSPPTASPDSGAESE